MDLTLKRTILIIIAWTGGILLVLALGWLVYFNSLFWLYRDHQFHFTIRFPKAWKVIIRPHQKQAGGKAVELKGQTPQAANAPVVCVVFIRPKDTALDTMRENFNVTVQPVPDAITSVDAFSAAIKRQMTGTFGDSIKVAVDKKIEWGWHEGHEMVFDAPSPDHLKLIHAWTIFHNQAFILTFLGDMNKYGGDRMLVNEMIRSFQLE